MSRVKRRKVTLRKTTRANVSSASTAPVAALPEMDDNYFEQNTHLTGALRAHFLLDSVAERWENDGGNRYKKLRWNKRCSCENRRGSNRCENCRSQDTYDDGDGFVVNDDEEESASIGEIQSQLFEIDRSNIFETRDEERRERQEEEEQPSTDDEDRAGKEKEEEEEENEESLRDQDIEGDYCSSTDDCDSGSSGGSGSERNTATSQLSRHFDVARSRSPSAFSRTPGGRGSSSLSAFSGMRTRATRAFTIESSGSSSDVTIVSNNGIQQQQSSASSIVEQMIALEGNGDEAKDDELECSQCMKNKVSVIIRPCNHIILCVECIRSNALFMYTDDGGSSSKYSCPKCRTPATSVEKIFF